MANFLAIDGPPGPSMAATDGPLCRKWSPTIFRFERPSYIFAHTLRLTFMHVSEISIFTGYSQWLASLLGIALALAMNEENDDDAMSYL